MHLLRILPLNDYCSSYGRLILLRVRKAQEYHRLKQKNGHWYFCITNFILNKRDGYTYLRTIILYCASSRRIIADVECHQIPMYALKCNSNESTWEEKKTSIYYCLTSRRTTIQPSDTRHMQNEQRNLFLPIISFETIFPRVCFQTNSI